MSVQTRTQPGRSQVSEIKPDEATTLPFLSFPLSLSVVHIYIYIIHIYALAFQRENLPTIPHLSRLLDMFLEISRFIRPPWVGKEALQCSVMRNEAVSRKCDLSRVLRVRKQKTNEGNRSLCKKPIDQ